MIPEGKWDLCLDPKTGLLYFVLDDKTKQPPSEDQEPLWALARKLCE